MLMSQTLIASAGKLLGFKQKLEMITSSVKNIQQDIDDKLHEALVEASSLVRIKKELNEINLLIQTIKSNDQDHEEISKLLGSIQAKLIESQKLVMKETQKAVLKCLHALNASQNCLMISSELESVIKLTQQMMEK